MNVFQLVGSFLIKGADKAKSDIKSTSSTAKSEFKGMGEEGVKGSEKVSQGFDRSAKAANPLIEAIKKIGKAIAAYMSIQAIKDFAQACVDAAAEVSAEASSFEQIMGDYSMEAQAKMQAVADATGVVDTRLTGSMTSMTAKFKGLGFSVEEATDLAARGLTIASDAAAFWDKSLQDSQAALNSFINGSYEGGEAIGLFANDTQMAAYAIQKGIVSTTAEWSALDEATKQATRLEYAENMMAMSGATGQAAKEAGNYANVKANLTEKWRQFKAVIGEPLMQNVVIPAMDRLIGVVDTASAGFQGMTQWVSENRDTISTIVGVVAAFATGLGVLAIAMNTTAIANGVLTAAYVVETAALNAAATAQGLLNAVMAANPIGIVIALISALVVAIVYFWNTSEEFRQFWIALWESIKEAVGVVVDAIVKFFTEDIPATFEKAGQFFEWLGDLIGGVFDAIGEAMTSAGDWARSKWEAVTSFFSGIPGKISGFFSGIPSKIGGFFTTAASTVRGQFDSLVSFVQSIPSRIVGFFSGIGSKITSAFGSIKFPSPHVSWNSYSVLGKSFSIPTIKFYASGGIVTDPTLGMIGEAGYDEAVVPLEPSKLKPFAKAVVTELDGSYNPGGGLTKEDMREALTEALGTIADLLQVNLVMNGRVLATSAAGDIDSVSGTRQMLVGRGLTV